MINLFTKIFGTKSERDIKALRPILQKIELESERLQNVSDDELRRSVQPIRDYISKQMEEVQSEIEKLEALERDSDSTDVYDREAWLEGVEKLKKLHEERLQIALTEMLPLAFAAMRETAKRLATNKKLVVAAGPFDKEIAIKGDYVTIEEDKAIWSNQWKAAGTPVVWDMAYYDVQMIGGIILHQGKIAEMATGEGKTLVATLPAFLNALAGEGVHIVTVNDYLAKRDAEWMAPLFEFHGLRVDCIDKHIPHSPGRKQAYQADITYGTNNEFGFDYLRDNMVSSPEELVQREPYFAMIDEVDSVLIDDARTPLIISGPVEDSNEQEYESFQPRIQELYEKQKTLVTQFLQEAKKKIAEGNEEEGGLALFRAHRGLPKHKPLVRYLSETGVKKTMHKVENYYLQDNSRMMPEADEPLLFIIEERNGSVELTEKGIEYITKAGEDVDFFVLPDIGVALSDLNGKFTSEEEELAAKQALAKDYNEKAQRIHVVQQLLKAYALFEKDIEYIVADRKVKLVDEQTGRVLEGRRYSDGLHQALEAKEDVKVEQATQTYANVTLQNYFRMYRKLAGMTGTAITEAGEFWDIYELDVVETPTHKPVARKDLDDKVYKTAREKFNAVIEEVSTLSQQGRPVLVGTTSVEVSELVSRMLAMKNIEHQVLNAKHHQKEAQIVAEAGKAGTVTIATNMAGRGTDIKLTPEAKRAGGLAIIGTERHESRRVDRQLRGRSGRQGDVGSSQFFVSLEDNLMRLFGSERIARVMDRMGLQEGEVIQHPLITRSIERAQKKVEQNNFA
ncbi:MAG: preprotein translocase subunit SecA, partial [Bacteroidota bacterium]